eukprot:9247371-Lingulodinium_polyedra.AAC.1
MGGGPRRGGPKRGRRQRRRSGCRGWRRPAPLCRLGTQLPRSLPDVQRASRLPHSTGAVGGPHSPWG